MFPIFFRVCLNAKRIQSAMYNRWANYGSMNRLAYSKIGSIVRATIIGFIKRCMICWRLISESEKETAIFISPTFSDCKTDNMNKFQISGKFYPPLRNFNRIIIVKAIVSLSWCFSMKLLNIL